MKKKDIVQNILMGSGAAERKAGPEIQVAKSAMKRYCFMQSSLFSDFGDEYELDTAQFSLKK